MAGQPMGAPGAREVYNTSREGRVFLERRICCFGGFGRYGSSAQPHPNSLLPHPQDLDAPLHVAARKKIAYRAQFANNRNITFMPAITSTSSHMYGEFLRLLFLQAHRETAAHFTATGMPAQQHCNSFRFRRARHSTRA